MIDLHCHALPGIDDGPRDMDEALALCHAASADGIEVLAATPHLRSDHPGVRPEELAERCEQLNDALRAERLSLHVVPGGEVDLLWAQAASDEELRLASLCQGGRALLVETPYAALGEDFEDLLFRVQVRGYRILLAHPERNATLREHPERLAALVQRGILVQVTAPAFRDEGHGGLRRSPSRRFALRLVRDGLAHVVSSDAHRIDGPRPVGLSEAVRTIENIRPGVGRWMSRDAPSALLSGTSVPSHPSLPGRRGLGSVLRRTRRGG
jgi:protein-tyrosine phosphatase